ncbi:MAG: ACT domain-containing protein [Mahellales bacterium]
MPEHQLNQAIECIGTFKNRLPKLRLDIFTEVTKLTVEGQGMERQSGVAAKMFNILAEQDIQIKIITTSETKISYIIDQIDEKAAVEAIIQAFEL